MKLYVGTSGYSYDAWRGVFYPDKLSAKKRLPYYAERLPAVEINNTYYRIPKTSVVEAWAEAVPDDFRFAIKASRRITHIGKLDGIEETLGYVVKSTEPLGEKLGVVLFQLPPYLRFDAEKLDRFLDLLPEDWPITMEFRHDSWSDDAVEERLRARRIAWCVSDEKVEDGEDAPFVATTDWGYFRLRRNAYSDEDLKRRINLAREAGWSHAFCFFKHETEGPAFAERMLESVNAE